MQLSDVRKIEFDLTTKCNAACPQCAREDPRNIGDKSFLNTNSEVTLENVKNWFPKETLDAVKIIKFCGSFSEPIVARDFLEIVRYFAENTTADFHVHTNGSARKVEWWSELGSIIGNRGFVRFGIDGLEDTHAIYRINTSYNRIIENAKAFMAAGGSAEWQFLVFKHNEHQLETAKLLSQKLGFKDFIFMASDRFYNKDDVQVTKEGYELRPSKLLQFRTFDEFWSKKETVIEIDCQSDREKWLMIDWNGFVYPCCYTMTWNSGGYADSDYWIEQLLKNNRNANNLHHSSLESVLKIFGQLYDDFRNGVKLNVCSGACGKCVDKAPV